MSTVIVWGLSWIIHSRKLSVFRWVPNSKICLVCSCYKEAEEFSNSVTFDFQCQFLVTCAVCGVDQYFYLLRKGCLKFEQTFIKRDFINHRLSKNRESTCSVKKECHFCSNCLYSTIKYFLTFLSQVSSSLNKLSLISFILAPL